MIVEQRDYHVYTGKLPELVRLYQDEGIPLQNELLGGLVGAFTTDIGALCNDVGHSILNAHAGRIREQLLRINDQVTGHRLLRGAVHPGGADLRQLPDPT